MPGVRRGTTGHGQWIAGYGRDGVPPPRISLHGGHHWVLVRVPIGLLEAQLGVLQSLAALLFGFLGFPAGLVLIGEGFYLLGV